MRFYSKTLTDVENEVYIEEWSVSSSELNVGEDWRIEKRRLLGGPSDGVDVVTVNNGVLSFTVVPTRGMSLWKGECQRLPIGWRSPVRHLVNPCFINLEERRGLGWLRGFNEWIVRCGLESFGASGIDVIRDNMGNEVEVLLPLHGRIANTPASLVMVKVGLNPPFELGVEGVIYESSMFGPNLKLKTSIVTTPGSRTVKISDEIENLRGVPDEMQILYHCNYGKPLLEEGSQLLAPIKRVAPRDEEASKGIDSFNLTGPPERGFIEQVYFMELLEGADGYTEAMLVNRGLDKAVSHRFSAKSLPFFTFWKNTAAEEDGYVVGLEPGTGFPNTRNFERKHGRVVKLGPGEKYNVEINVSLLLGRAEVEEAISRIEAIKGGAKPIIYREPIEEFSCV
ncbi:MAG: aldose 1-epimerase family protein [Candidatus Bathyarchaeia archaeon]